MLCPGCSADNHGDAAVCAHCGTSLTAGGAPRSSPRPAAAAFDPVRLPPRPLSTIRKLFRLSATIMGPGDPK